VTVKGADVPLLKSPLSRRFGLHAGALELAAADVDDVDETVEESVVESVVDDATELSLVVDRAADEEDSVELSETVEVADEVLLEEIPELGSTSPQGGTWSTALGLYRNEN
jgi:hypothetical protein